MKNTDDSGNELSSFEKPSTRQWVWDDTRAFLAVARLGTLSGAASRLDLSIATLSRRIERLEKALMLPLFVRLQSGYQLTQEGTEMVEKAEVMEAAAAAFSMAVSSQAQPSGTVRLATAENLANELIVPALPEFYQQFPGITIEFITDISTVNLHRRDADLAVRMVRPEAGNVSLRQIGTLGYGLYGSKDYLEKHEFHTATCKLAIKDAEVRNYRQASFIGWNEMRSHLPASKWINQTLQGRDPVLTTTSLATQIAAANSGLGLAVLPHFLAVKAGLVCIRSELGIDQPIYLVIQSDLAHSRRTRAVADFLIELTEHHQALLSG